MRSVAEILAEHGIRAKRANGSWKTTCPQCSPRRRHKDDPCLSVTVKPDGVVWNCHHCGWSAGGYFDDSRRQAQPAAKALPARAPSPWGRLQREAGAHWARRTP